MYCSNFARTQSQPLISKFPIRPQFPVLNPSISPIQFDPKAIQNNLQSEPKSSILCCHPKSRNLFLGARVFSSGYNLKEKRQLPWISSAYKSKNREKKDNVNTNRSSWVDSAENLLKNERSLNAGAESKNEVSETAFDDERSRRRDARTNAVEIVDKSEEVEPVNQPRWDGAKYKYTKFFDSRESRFERPEVRNWNKQEDWGRRVWKESKESSLPKMAGQGVYGVGPVLAALRAERREFYALYVQEGLVLSGNNKKRKDKKGVETILKLAGKLGLKVIETSKHDLNMIVDSRPHQGLVVDASPLDIVNIKELETVSVDGKKAPVWVALDEVTDPQNLGAIIRSSYYFGVEGVVLCAKNSAPLSGVVSKASAGSLELIELRACKNMMQFLTSSVDNGWRVIGGSVSSKARNLNEIEANVPTILVLGSEGSGLRPLVERSCSELVKIPGNISLDESEENNDYHDEEIDISGKKKEVSSFLAVESLNVSVAAGVLLYHLVGNNYHLGGIGLYGQEWKLIHPELQRRIKEAQDSIGSRVAKRRRGNDVV